MEIVQLIEKLATNSYQNEISINAIILIGSNFNLTSLQKNTNNNSDIDVIILSESDHFQVSKKHLEINFDLSFINQNDIARILNSSLNGSKFFGKILSSINKCTLIKDNDKIGKTFISLTRELYKIYTNTCLPNYVVNEVYLYNINANKKDLKKIEIEEAFFAYHRLSVHLFNHIAQLVYPFHTSGSHRGVVIKKYFNSFKKDIVLDKNRCPLINIDIIEKT